MCKEGDGDNGCMTRVLVTGFESFGGDRVNASQEAVARIDVEALRARGVEVIRETLPVTFVGGPDALEAAIGQHLPDVVVCVGEAGGRGEVTPELNAVNDQVARIADNDGRQPAGALDDGPAVLTATLDPAQLVTAIRDAGIPARVSEDAGRYVCNAVFRASLTRFSGPAAFIHVPAYREVGIAVTGAETDDVAPVVAELTFDDLGRALTAALGSLAG